MDATLPALPLSATTPAPPPAPGPTADPAVAKKTGQDFESFFLSQVFENMFAGTDTDALFGGGTGETVYRSLLLQQYSKVAAKHGGIGIADAVQREILQMQEKEK